MIEQLSAFLATSGGRSLVLAWLVAVGGTMMLLGEKEMGREIASHSFLALCILIEPGSVAVSKPPVRPVGE